VANGICGGGEGRGVSPEGLFMVEGIGDCERTSASRSRGHRWCLSG
jgi:hypothetical protein